MTQATTIELLSSRLEAVQSRVDHAATAAGRNPAEVTIVGVTKTVGREAVELAYHLGMRTFGENRVQDAMAKFQDPLPDDAALHMIGTLQSNKAKQAVRLFDVIQSVDRRSLVDALARVTEQSDRTIDILIEVNVAGEAQKAGCPFEEAPALLEYIRAHETLRVQGLMTMAPLVVDPDVVRPVFRNLARLAETLRQSSGLELPMLSMGMSNDFEVAISEGATHVRIGRAIFGG
jgi:hypothetical protein